jgi:hypothetical protein
MISSKTKKNKTLRINLIQVRNLYNEIYKTLEKQIEEDEKTSQN